MLDSPSDFDWFLVGLASWPVWFSGNWDMSKQNWPLWGVSSLFAAGSWQVDHFYPEMIRLIWPLVCSLLFTPSLHHECKSDCENILKSLYQDFGVVRRDLRCLLPENQPITDYPYPISMDMGEPCIWERTLGWGGGSGRRKGSEGAPQRTGMGEMTELGGLEAKTRELKGVREGGSLCRGVKRWIGREYCIWEEWIRNDQLEGRAVRKMKKGTN